MITKFKIFETLDETIEDKMMYYARKGYIDMIEQKIKEGVDIDIVGRTELTPLLMACKESEYETVEWLIEHGADINFQSKLMKITALYLSALNNTFNDITIMLIDAGADWNMENYQGETFLDILKNRSHNNKYKEIIEKYPDKYQIYLKRKKAKEFNI